VTLRERVSVADFESEHFAAQLVERLGWAVGDAHEVERVGETEAPPEPSTDPAEPTVDLADSGEPALAGPAEPTFGAADRLSVPSPA
jgi:hypothetical protein